MGSLVPPGADGEIAQRMLYYGMFLNLVRLLQRFPFAARRQSSSTISAARAVSVPAALCGGFLPILLVAVAVRAW
jgi:hypothetical protein